MEFIRCFSQRLPLQKASPLCIFFRGARDLISEAYRHYHGYFCSPARERAADGIGKDTSLKGECLGQEPEVVEVHRPAVRGAHWSGPRFFGLNGKAEAGVAIGEAADG